VLLFNKEEAPSLEKLKAGSKVEEILVLNY
jgi:hypothetical protein